MKKVLVIFALIFGSIFANAQADFYRDTLYKGDINSKTAYEMQQKGALLIDVRTKREFKESRAKDSINIPIFFEKAGQRALNEQFLVQINEALKGDVNKQIILICRSGSRTKFASNILAYKGFSNVYNIKNGFAYDWAKTSLPTEK